jgi:hypothetical protein
MTAATSLGQKCPKLRLKTLSMKCEKRSEKKWEECFFWVQLKRHGKVPKILYFVSLPCLGDMGGEAAGDGAE